MQIVVVVVAVDDDLNDSVGQRVIEYRNVLCRSITFFRRGSMGEV